MPKLPVGGSVWVSREGLERDHNRYRTEKLRGDPDSAVLLLALSSIQAHAEAGFPVGPGSMGENLTLSDLVETEMAPGQRWKVGRAVVQISRACTPCHNLDIYGTGLLKQAIGRRGWYARVLEEGPVKAGDEAVLLADV
ncbi:MAG: MOSC domain-containing protein [Euryarchaeota archaeon]|nr:MOSC domain-containing protein [Euryarchaeota archaeon]MDE1837067.1 MOSC domain-containing protein [Euryarchaeota archaeon]MDE1880998.1 MOSC domain-containing protein [Euryarchaeota archaeon]MDE2046430.1 MOSC domain-containing protein [Thermoplasmata archaeon]